MPGKSMMERKLYLQEHHDYIRTTLMQEPRGNSGVAAMIVAPCDPEADFGVIFSDFRGYVDMCVHGTIGVVTTLVERSLVSGRVLEAGRFVFDTPAGLVHSKTNFSRTAKNRVESVTVSNVPSFFVRDIQIDLPDRGGLTASIAYGGNFYAYVDAREVGLGLAPSNLREILRVGRLLLNEIKQAVGDISHHEMRSLRGIAGVSLYEDEDRTHAKNIMIGDNDLFDRSPCGTGTCGRMATLHFKGRLNYDEKFVNRSIIDSEFVGRIKKGRAVGQYDTVQPEITGSAFLTGISDLIISDGDRLGMGFLPW